MHLEWQNKRGEKIAVHAEAHSDIVVLRLDVNVGSPTLRGIGENGGDNLGYRSILDNLGGNILTLYFLLLGTSLDSESGFEFGERLGHFSGKTLVFIEYVLEILSAYGEELIGHTDLRRDEV